MKGESGEFRVACHGAEPFRISLDKLKIFGNDYFPNYEFEMVFPIDELKFKESVLKFFCYVYLLFLIVDN